MPPPPVAQVSDIFSALHAPPPGSRQEALMREARALAADFRVLGAAAALRSLAEEGGWSMQDLRERQEILGAADLAWDVGYWLMAGRSSNCGSLRAL